MPYLFTKFEMDYQIFYTKMININWGNFKAKFNE